MKRQNLTHLFLNSLPFFVVTICSFIHLAMNPGETIFQLSGYLALGLSCSLMLFMYDLKQESLFLAAIILQMHKILEASGIEFDLNKLKEKGLWPVKEKKKAVK